MNRLVTTVFVTTGHQAIAWLSKDGNTENLVHNIISAMPGIEEKRSWNTAGKGRR